MQDLVNTALMLDMSYDSQVEKLFQMTFFGSDDEIWSLWRLISLSAFSFPQKQKFKFLMNSRTSSSGFCYQRLLEFSSNEALVQILLIVLSWIESWKLRACDSHHFHQTTHYHYRGQCGIICYNSALLYLSFPFILCPVCINTCTKNLCKVVIKHEINRQVSQNYISSNATSGSRNNVLFLLLLQMWSVVSHVAQPSSSTEAELLLFTSIS